MLCGPVLPLQLLELPDNLFTVTGIYGIKQSLRFFAWKHCPSALKRTLQPVAPLLPFCIAGEQLVLQHFACLLEGLGNLVRFTARLPLRKVQPDLPFPLQLL
ncbi:hypothetical protein D3C86_2035200 [compost metagenome]